MIGLWRIEDPAEVDVVATEQRIKVSVAGVPFVGVIDRVDLNWDRAKVILRDYKAGLAPPPNLRFAGRHDEQLRVYALAWAAHAGGPLPAAAQVLYVAHGQARKVGLSAKRLIEASDGLVRAWDRMLGFAEMAVFPTRASPLCGWCPLAQVCPSAAAAGRAEPRSPQALIGPVLGIAALPEPIFATGAVVAPGVRAEPARRPLVDADDTSRPESGRLIGRGSTMRHEDKPWVEEIEGRLNFSSYAAGAAFGLAGLAVETLHQAGVALTGQTVFALADTFATVIADVQRAMNAKLNMAEGLHTRLRGALRTSLATLPAPLGGDQEAWAAWVAGTERRLRTIATVAERLWETERGEPGQP
jgi:putative RecB family exonuclease